MWSARDVSDEVVVPIRNARSIRNLAVGALLLLAFAAGGAASVAGVDDQTTGVRVVSGILAAICLLVGIGCVVALVVSVPRREIVVGAQGVSWRTARGVAWR